MKSNWLIGMVVSTLSFIVGTTLIGVANCNTGCEQYVVAGSAIGITISSVIWFAICGVQSTA